MCTFLTGPHEDHEDGYHSPKSHKGSSYASPFHEHEGHEDSYKELYGDDDHHPSHDEVDGFHGGEGGSHHALSATSTNSNNPDAAFEKEFENKINDKDYSDDGHEAPHHTSRHESHRPHNHGGDEYVDEGDHYPHNNEGEVSPLFLSL